MQRLLSFFQLESARKIRFVKEDEFIRKALSTPNNLPTDDAVLVRLLEGRKHYLTEIIRECERERLEHGLLDEVKLLDKIIQSHRMLSCVQRTPALEV